MAEADEAAINEASWDDIEFLYNEDTITKTFGVCNYDCMYEMQTIATVNANGPVTQNPTIRAVKNGEEICVAINCNFFIFSDNYYDIKLSLRADAIIDSFAVSGDFILIGESSGQLKLIFIPLVQTVLSKKMFNAGFKEVAFSHRNNKGLYEAFTCSSDNILYKILNIDLDQLSKALSESDMTRARVLCDQMEISNSLSEVTDGFLIKHCDAYADADLNFSVLLSGSGSAVLKIINDCDRQRVLDGDVFNGAFLLKAEFSNDGRYIIVLDSENILHFLCARSLLVLKSWFHVKIFDFMFWESDRSKYETETDKLLILTLPDDGCSELLMLNFPTFELAYTTKLSSHSSFVRMSAQQRVFLTQKREYSLVSFSSSDVNRVTRIKIKCVQEMQPEAKLSRLLKKRRFKDAVQFANLFKLDKEVIYWTQLNCVFEDMMFDKYCALTKETTSDLESTLFNCLYNIKDPTLLIECCRHLMLPTLELYTKFLKAVKLKVNVDKHVAELNGIFYRLQTFQLTFGEENLKSRWQSFSSCNMLNEFLKYFQDGQVGVAINLWLRHEDEIIQDACIEDLLNVINSNLNTKCFFSTIMPSILKFKPESLVVLSDWIIMYCKNYELCDKEDWPSKALDFTEKALETIKSFNLNFEFTAINLNLVKNCIRLLSNFKVELEDLRELWDNYKCYISYANSIQRDKTVVCCQMLDDVFENTDLLRFISVYLASFAKRFGLNTDVLLLAYIEKMLSYMCASSWEHVYVNDRILTIIQNILSNECICRAVLAVVTSAEIPWNETVEELVKKCLPLDHALVSEIKEQLRFADVKKILIPYGLKNFNLSNKNLIVQTTRYIAMQNSSTSLSDALEISKLSGGMINETDVYLFKLQHLVINGSEDDFISAVRTIPRDSLLVCCHRFVNYIIVLINANNDVNLPENINEEIQSIKAALTVIRYTAVRCETDKFEIQRGKLQSIIALKTEFDIHMSYDQLESTMHCENTFQQRVNSSFSTGMDRTKLNALFRLGQVMKLKLEDLAVFFINEAIECENGEVAIEVLLRLKLDYSHTSSNKFLYCICKLLASVVHMKLQTSEEKQILFAKLVSLLVQLNSNEASAYTSGLYRELVYIIADSDDTLTSSVLSLISILLRMDKSEEKIKDDLIALSERVCGLLQSKGALMLSLELASRINGYLASFEAALVTKDVFNIQFLLSSLFKNPLDKQLALGLGVCLSVESLNHLLNKALRNFNYDCEQTETVADLACLIFKFLNFTREETLFTSLHKQVLWKKKISDLKIDSDFGSSEIEDEIDWQNCIRKFALNRTIPFEFVVEFCTAFTGCLDSALVYYLDCLLTRSDVYSHDSDFISDSFSREIPECMELGKIVDEAINLVENKVCLLNKLKSILKKMSPYDYEKILMVLCHIKSLIENDEKEDSNAVESVQKKIDLLKFLFAYRRVQPPADSENEMILKFGCDRAKYRLPFHTLGNGNPWHILPAELNMDTIDIWTCVVPLLQLSHSEEIIAIAVQNEVKRSLREPRDNDELHKRPFPRSKLEKIFTIIKEIDPKLSLPCGKWVTEHLPLGLEKVYAAKCNLELARHWAYAKREKLVTSYSMSVNTYEEILKKLTKDYERISTEFVLLNHNLRSDETLRLIQTPVKLLIHLYQKKDDKLYEVIKEISEIHEINHGEIEMKLIDKWLAQSSAHIDETQDDLLENAIYILRHLPNEECVWYLLAKIVQEESCRNYVYRYNALKCLAAIADPIDIQRYSKNFITDTSLRNMSRTQSIQYGKCPLCSLDQYPKKMGPADVSGNTAVRLALCPDRTEQFLLAFYYLSQLESLNFHLTLPSYLNCNRENLASTIWSKLNRSHKVVDLISSFCVDYAIRNLKLYEDLLNEMVSRNMVNSIEKFMLAELWQSSSFIAAWQFILMWPFQNGTFSEKANVTDHVKLAEKLYRSPVCSHVFLDKLCSEFVAVGQTTIGIGCLFHISEVDHRTEILERYSDENQLKNICDNLIRFHDEAINFPQMSSVLTFLVSREGFYNILLDTPYYNLLTLRLINQNTIARVLEYLNRTERWEDCRRLIEEFFEKYPNPKFQKMLSSFKNERDLVKELLKTHCHGYAVHKNSEKRKEKSRVAARNRRGMECEIFTQLADELPLPSKVCSQMDKASIMRVAIGYIKIRHLLNQMNLTNLKLENTSDKLLMKALEGFLLIISEDGEIIYLSENVTQYLGLTQVDLLGQSVFDYSHPCDHREIRETLVLKSNSENGSQTVQSLFIRMKCTITDKGKSVNMKSALYKVIHFTGQVIREKPESASNCREANTLIPSLGNCMVAIGEPIAHPSDIEVPLDKQTFLSRHNLDMSFTYVDDKVDEILGYSSDDIIGKKLYQFHHAQDAEAIDKFYKILFAKGQCETGCYRFLAKHGGHVWVLTRATIIYGGKAKNKPLCVVCVNYILSGLENADEIVSIEQIAAPRPAKECVEENHKESVPLNTTNTIFAPRTKDMNKGFLTFIDDESGYTVLNDEPDDLTHLAPTSGDVCIPLDVPIFSNDMFEDVLFTDSFCDSDMMTDLSCIGDDALQTRPAIPLTNDPLLSFRADRVSSTDSDDVPNLCSKQNSPVDLDSSGLISSDSEKSKYNDSSGSSVDRLMFLGMKVESTNDLTDKSDVELEGDEFDLRAPYIPIGVGEDLPLLTPAENMWNSSTDSPGVQSRQKQVSTDSTVTNSSIVTSKSSLAKLLQSSLPLTTKSVKSSILRSNDGERVYFTIYFFSQDVRYKSKSQFDGGGTINFSKNETFAQNEDNLCKLSQKRTRALSCTKRMVNKRAKMDISMAETVLEDSKQHKSDDEKTTTFKNSVLLNLLVSGHDVSHGYSCYADKGKAKKNTTKNNGMQSREIRFRDSNRAASLITPEGSMIPNLLDITQLDMEVNAPVYKSQDLLQGQELLNALDSTLVTNDSCVIILEY
uniref:RZZ complex subunit KNTC1/ROD C-terminal domain-containing protein n=1 Tax=Strigamia maritima TaxID=126957 RepID=T1J615_STRMM